MDSAGSSLQTGPMASAPHAPKTPATSPNSLAPGERGERRGVPGLLVILVLACLGIASGAGYFHYKAPRLRAELHAQVAAAPTSTGGRLEKWVRYGAANIHHRLAIFGRFSEERPWLITHGIGVPGGTVEIWGVDCDSIPKDLCTIEGSTVVVTLPRPSVQGHGVLNSEERLYIPIYASEADVPDPAARLRSLALHLLEGMPEALAKDIEGGRIEIRVRDGGGSETPEAAAGD